MNKPVSPPISRRTVFAGAGAVGALAAVAAVLPVAPKAAAPTVAALPEPVEETGYRLTEHVKQYYATARI
jgi:hypothetical protein